MVCTKCKKDKSSNEFYFIDGGLGYSKNKFSICKVCVKEYNDSRTTLKYFDEQITAQFYGAKSVINGDKLTSIARRIENGITEGSNRMGIQNFLFLFQYKGGLSSSSKQMKKIYNALTTFDKVVYPDEIENKVLSEGAKKQVIVNAYERNQKARQECIKYYGAKCYICNFDFEKKYGEIGKGFIHIHHKKPLSEINEEYEVDPIQDLIPVCPNCHAMIHMKKPAYSIDEIQSLLAKNDL